jgi:hypothetical protein
MQSDSHSTALCPSPTGSGRGEESGACAFVQKLPLGYNQGKSPSTAAPEYVKKGNNPMAMTFEQVIEMIRQFPDEQQEMLVDLIRGWRTETRRREIARDAQESLAAFRSGQLEPQSAQAVITELRQSLEDQE